MTHVATTPGKGVQGTAWFALMVAAWTAFGTLALADPETLHDFGDWVAGLPLALEILVWIATLPWMLALTVWESSWEQWAQVLVIVLLALFWTRVSAPSARA